MVHFLMKRGKRDLVNESEDWDHDYTLKKNDTPSAREY